MGQIRVVKNEKEFYTLDVVYEPYTDEEIKTNPELADAHGDYADAETIEKACWEFTKSIQNKEVIAKLGDLLEGIKKASEGDVVEVDITELLEELSKASNPIGFMHCVCSQNFGDIVENYIAPADFEINGQDVRKGSWLIGVKWHPELFAKIESGEYTGVSLEGTATPVEVNIN